jgi:integrase
MPAHFRAYNITYNPVKETVNPRPTTEEKPPIKALDLAQMRWYFKQLQKVEGLRGACLRLHLMSGGQRPAQLVRLRRDQVEADHFILIDRKGRGSKARRHPVPITASIRKELDALNLNGYLLSANGGRSAIVPQTLTNWAAEVVDDAIPGFQIKHVRSGVETLLSKWKLHKEQRGRLQSHGISGVQDAHYDANDFIDQSYEALEILEAVLEGLLTEPPRNSLLDNLRQRQAAAQT